jgi:hypothetical protein
VPQDVLRTCFATCYALHCSSGGLLTVRCAAHWIRETSDRSRGRHGGCTVASNRLSEFSLLRTGATLHCRVTRRFHWQALWHHEETSKRLLGSARLGSARRDAIFEGRAAARHFLVGIFDGVRATTARPRNSTAAKSVDR